ncbi:MAG TPA: 30S ribosomal protein S15 [Candidatus Paceibacterota bacterium]|jgi:small subunit ribosomal protein S15|nr:30S ribosomal protein S15 [Candidatus Pacearchaeota archaeon]HRR39354.1 30S ribosomal protein S15 [Candidatus Paceibacterota bacterium]
MKKEEIIKKYKLHETDTGSAEIQIALLTEEIKNLTEHLKSQKKDNDCRRSLLKKVAKRKKLLDWLKQEDEKRYNNIVKKLKL